MTEPNWQDNFYSPNSTILLTENGRTLARAESISYSITRQMAPISLFGYIDPREVIHRRRGIAGSIIMNASEKRYLVQNIPGPSGTFPIVDQIPSFDVNILQLQERTIKRMKIYGVEVLNEGMGTSVDPPPSEIQVTFIARRITPWVDYRIAPAGEEENHPTGREIFEF